MGAHFVPMAIPETCVLTEPLNSKKFFLSTNSTILINFLVKILFCSLLSKTFLSPFNPALCGKHGFRVLVPVCKIHGCY